ncbi:MAG: 8-amino-7-oxononanoate synthase [Clostridium sp.]|nr:8-amino-7-oxononanoate synthase [Clostridium sp.]MDU7082835.1 8-amino-7-oxononanoate synthase [Clostridium sp.]
MNELLEMEEKLNLLKERSLYRNLKVISSEQTSSAVVDGNIKLMLCSNSYLDMSSDKRVKDFVKEIIYTYGTGAGGSRLTTGSYNLHSKLEEILAEMKHTEAALVFNTGYMANVGVISAICDEDYIIFSDELNHASIIDGCRLSKAKTIIYRHNDMVDLEKKLKENTYKKGLIVTDGVFSMDGDIANLPEIIKLSKKYRVLTMVDDAHGTGVLGRHGRGTAEYHGVEGLIDIYMGTLSKAIGSEGGFVCGSRVMIEYLKNSARSFIFSTALSPATIAASLKALEILRVDNRKISDLQENIKYFCHLLNQMGIEVSSESAIIPIIMGDENKALSAAEELLKEGIFVSAIRYPTVEKGKARLRITIMASHSKEELKFAAEKIAAVVSKCKIV